jgi:hypothetical protein
MGHRVLYLLKLLFAEKRSENSGAYLYIPSLNTDSNHRSSKQPPTNYCPGADGLFPCVFNGCKHTMDGTIKAVTQHMGNHCTPPIDDDSEKKLACPDVHCRERSKPMPLRSLGRHIASTHFLTTQVACDGCGSTFTRRDSVRKHVCSATPGSTPGADEPPQKKRRL